MAVAITNLIALAFIAVPLVVGDAERVSREEYLKLRSQLKSLNKPAVLSIKTADGDMFDCVDIHKQPAFDHPLLKYHKIQMRPTSFPKGLESNATSEMGVESNVTSKQGWKVGLPDGGCPQGTVPIRRIRMQDLLRFRSLYRFGKKVLDIRTGEHSAFAEADGEFYGTQVQMSLWNTPVKQMEVSLGKFWIISGKPGTFDSVEAGWMVNPEIYGDHQARLFVAWMANGDIITGCYNTLCPGFVQVSRDVAPGSAVRPVSTYNGKQQYIILRAFKDIATKNWWVAFGENGNEKLLGYYPKSLFKSLADRASIVRWGGEVYNGQGIGQPAMGSGHFASEGYRKAAYMKKIMTVDNKNTLRDAPSDMRAATDMPNCYSVDNPNQFGDDNWRRFFYFGGPGCYPFE